MKLTTKLRDDLLGCLRSTDRHTVHGTAAAIVVSLAEDHAVLDRTLPDSVEERVAAAISPVVNSGHACDDQIIDAAISELNRLGLLTVNARGYVTDRP